MLQRKRSGQRGVRILVLLSDAFGGYGGIAAYNRDLLAALCADPDVEAVVAVPRIAKEPLGHLPDKLQFDLAGLGGITRYARAALGHGASRPGFDLVICGHINLAPLGWLCAKIARAPLLLQIYGIEAWRPGPRKAARTFAGRVDHVLSISNITLDRFRAWQPVPTERCSVVPLAIDLQLFSPGAKNEELAHRLGVAGCKVILTFGRLAGRERYKGFDEVLDVLPRIVEVHPAIRYVIAGDGEDSTRLREKARLLGVSQHVVFTGMIDERDKVDLYRLADVYAMPSAGEGFGFVILEAMACGVPVIASTIDGGREAVRDGALGMMVDPTDRDALCDAVLQSLNKPNAVPTGIEHFTVENFQERIRGVVRAAIGSRP